LQTFNKIREKIGFVWRSHVVLGDEGVGSYIMKHEVCHLPLLFLRERHAHSAVGDSLF